MDLPGLKLKRRPNAPPPDDYSKWGWYIMAAMAVVWVIYDVFFKK